MNHIGDNNRPVHYFSFLYLEICKHPCRDVEVIVSRAVGEYQGALRMYEGLWIGNSALDVGCTP